MDKQRILLCFFAWMVAQVSGTYNEQARLNERAIESQWLTLEESVMRDVLELKESFNKIVGDINTAFGEYRAFTEGSVTELNLHIDSEMKQNDEALEENTKLLEDFTKSQVKEMDKTLLENLQTLSSTMAQERSSIVSWAHQRSTFHEDILKTDVALCAFDYDDEKRTGVVNYNGRHSGYLTDQKSWRVFNETCNQESCAKEVLNRDTGRFTVPQNADGLYLFTFSITMDTFDYLEGHTWDYYYFRKNGYKVAGTGLYGNVGSNPHSDMFPGSRTIILDLKVGDYVDVFQTKGKAVPDLQALFCGSLIHLTKVSIKLVLKTISISKPFCRLLLVLEVGRLTKTILRSHRLPLILCPTMSILIPKHLNMLNLLMVSLVTKPRRAFQQVGQRWRTIG